MAVLTAPTQSVSTQSLLEQFESIYVDAQGDASRIPWAGLQPNPALVTWLNAVAPSLVRCGSRVCVVGCGLGDDAQELMKRGYDVTAFDCSRTAVEWAKKRDTENTRCYVQADLFKSPARWRHRFDLVVEVNTIQSLPPELHESAISAIAEMVSPRGYLLAICRAADHPPIFEDGPPWPLTESQLLQAAAISNLHAVDPPAIFMDDEDPPVQRMRVLFNRA